MKTKKTTQVSNEWKHILLMGCDSRKPGGYERSDSMIILSIGQRGEVRLTSIMRDIWVELPGHGEGRINAASSYGGPELAMQVASRYFDLQIEKYVMVNVKSMVNIIDLLGGVDLEITELERLYLNSCTVRTQWESYSEREIPPLEHSGLVHLCGDQAVEHTRNRFVGGADYARTARQRKVLKAIAKKIRTKKNPIWLLGMIRRCRKLVETNLNPLELGRIALLALRTNPDAIGCFRIPAEGTYTINKVGGWHFETDFEKNRQLLREFLKNGGEADEMQ